jgi:hypothetical protein
MMKIRFDYVDDVSPTQRLAWGGLVVSLLVVAAATFEYTHLQEIRAGLQLRQQALTARSVATVVAPMPEEKRIKLQEQANQANLVLAELGRPWAALFDQLENNLSPDIALLAIRPDASRGRLRISGEARHLSDALDFVRRLGDSGQLADVVLESHEVVEADPQKPVRFAVSMRWGA